MKELKTGRLQESINASFKPTLTYITGRDGFSPIPVKVMDDSTYQLVQIDDVYKAVNSTQTRTGDLVLSRSLRQPLTDATLIAEKQKALAELRSNSELRQQVEEFVQRAGRDEQSFYGFHAKEYSKRWLGWPTTIHNSYKGSVRFMRNLMKGLGSVIPESDYLKALDQNLTDLREDEISAYIKKPLRASLYKGLRQPSEMRKYLPEPWLEYRPTDFRAYRFTALVAPIAGIFAASLSKDPSSMLLAIYGSMAYMVYLPLIVGLGRNFDEKVFTQPFDNRTHSNTAVINAVESLGKLDELLSLVNYADSLKAPITLPEVVDAPKHFFEARGLRNPALVGTNPYYVPNDIDLDGARVTFLTGPNSGGKTALTKTILQAQVLAQIGSYIPAKQARISIADKILYQSRMVNRIQDQEGGFGVEAETTRDIVFGVPPGRFIIGLDDLMGATTYEEGSRHSEDILNALYLLEGNTIFITHNHELAESFEQRRRGQFWQVEFDDKKPTHRIKPGISRKSHSDFVLERIGFTRADIQRHLGNLGINSNSSQSE